MTVGVTEGPYLYLDPRGVIVPDTADIQAGAEDTFKSGLGEDLDVTTPGTPQFILIAAETIARSEVVANNAAVGNQINPNIAGGIFLEALCALTGVEIPNATPSLVAGVTVTGQPFATIPAGSQAETLDDTDTPTGNIFRTTEIIQLDVNGAGTVGFEAIENGPVPCPAGALRRITSDVLGWETVSNSNSAALGTLAPSDAQIRALRNNTLASQGQGLPECVTSFVSQVQGVLSLKFRNNKSRAPVVVDGVTMKANSVWACVQGGSDAEVANAIYTSVGGGCDFNGAVSVTLTDPYSGQVETVQFDRPTAVPVLVRATVVLPNSGVTTDQVRQAILAYAAGLISGQAGFVVGASVSPWDIGGAVVVEVSGVFIKKLEVALKSDGIFILDAIPVSLFQAATLASSDISVVVVQ